MSTTLRKENPPTSGRKKPRLFRKHEDVRSEYHIYLLEVDCLTDKNIVQKIDPLTTCAIPYRVIIRLGNKAEVKPDFPKVDR